jgi:ATP-dependent Clp protease ATP-binding subunit ClpC
VILIMTTNAGAHAIKNESRLGFETARNDDDSYDGMKERVMEQIERVFRPEFINRLDDVIVFRHLRTEDLKQVIDLELKKVRERLSERGYTLTLTDSAKEFLIKKGSNTDFGARPLRRAVENYIEDPLAEEILKGEFQGKDTIVVDAIKDDEDKPRRLDFKGEIRNAAPPAEPVAAGAPEGESK